MSANGGVMQFALGLSTGGFTSALAGAQARIVGFVGSMIGTGAIIEGIWSQIEKGGALKDLSNRTGESVGSLYQLREAFKEVGLSSEAVSPMLMRMQKALSGMDEMGIKTGPAFERLGLDMERLKGMAAPQQLEAMAAALAKLPREEAVAIAGKLVGREGAGDLMQMTRDIKGFRDALEDTRKGAETFGRSANLFKGIGDEIGKLKRHIAEMWAGIASGAGPALQRALEQFSSVDFTRFGERIGKEIELAFESVRLERFGEYFKLTLQAASFEVGAMLTKYLGRQLGRQSGGTSAQPGFLKRAGYGAMGVGAGILGIGGEFGAMLGITSAGKMADTRLDQAYALFEKAGIGEGILMDAAKPFSEGMAMEVNKYAKQLEELRRGLDASAEEWRRKRTPIDKAIGAESKDKEQKGKPYEYKPEFTSLEKMGFVMKGFAGYDFARTTATNTTKMVTLLERLASKSGVDESSDGIHL